MAFGTRLYNTWSNLDFQTKCIIGFALLLLIYAYLPSLQINYITEDQWRTFRYSVWPGRQASRFHSCMYSVYPFYNLTGRPLVWLPECIDHTFITQIASFIFYRPISLLIVLFSAISLGSVFKPLVGGITTGILVAIAFLMAPPYTFMALQGMPALMVLICVLLAAGSIHSLNNRKSAKVGLIKPALMFLAACFIYPAWAFIVIPLAWLYFIFNADDSFKIRGKRLIFTLGFYFVVAVFYYFLVKLLIIYTKHTTDWNLDGSFYNVKMQLSPAIIFERIKMAAELFYALTPFNFKSPNGTFLIIIGIVSISYAQRIYKKTSNFLVAILSGLGVFFVSILICIIAIAPFIMSQMNAIVTRHVLPWHMFIYLALPGSIYCLIKDNAPKVKRYLPVLILIFGILPLSFIQNKLTFFEAVTSNIEIEYLRLKMSQWLDNNRLTIQNKLILVVLPNKERLAFIEHMYKDEDKWRGNFVLSSSQNPVAIPWMVNAVLRERRDHVIGIKVHMQYCQEDEKCIYENINKPNTIVLAAFHATDKPIKLPVEPYIINFNDITSSQDKPLIQIKRDRSSR